MVIITTTKQLRPRNDHDFYPTPVPLIEAALALLPRPQTGLALSEPFAVLDPGAGDGVWGKAARRLWGKEVSIDGVEKRPAPHPIEYTHWWDRSDYRDWQPRRQYDVIIGNPPYAEAVLNPKTGKFKSKPLAEKFVRKSLDALRPGGLCLFLLRLAFLESAERVDLYANFPPRMVYVLVNRPSFGAVYNGGTDSTAYAIFLWEKGWMGQPKLGWLDWKE